MRGERTELDRALKAATDRTPQIVRGIVHAKSAGKPLPWRKRELDMAISQARALLDELLLYKVRLGWHHNREGDAA